MGLTRSLVASVVFLGGSLLLAAPAGAATFNADPPSLGQIPDSPAGGTLCGDYSGAPLNVTFTVTGVSAPVTDVQASVTFGQGTTTPVTIGHSWIGDLRVTLLAPGGAPTGKIFSQTGSTTATGCGDDSNANGPYVFSDTAPAGPTWLAAAQAVGSTAFIPAGSYRPSTDGGVAGGNANALITPTFAGLTTPQTNGVWILRVHDGGQGDTGAVVAASLSINGAQTATPTLTSTVPASPADNNTPSVKGTAAAGSTVNLYKTADCSGAPAATGTAAALASAGIPISVPDDSTTAIRATASTGTPSGCSAPLTYVEDSSAAAPLLTGTDPASPGNSTTPLVQGAAEAGSQVTLYTSADCSGAPAATGTAAELGGAGIAVPVPADAVTKITATATDALGHLSACSGALTYAQDSVPGAPAPPSLTGTDPASPSSSTTPRVKGTAEPGVTVALFESSNCAGIAAATGTAAQLADPGIAVTVPAGATTQLSATATDIAGQTSGCSAPIDYVAQAVGGGPLDNDPPETSFKKTPKKKTDDTTPTFKLLSDEPGSTFLCKVDKKPFKSCGAKRTFHLKPGKHKVRVAAVDAAGNVDPTPAKFKFKIEG